MPNTLSGLYGSLPAGIQGYEAARQSNQAQGMNELAQASGAMGLLAKIRQQQQEEALRQGLSQLGPNATEEQIINLATQAAPAKDILHYRMQSADAKMRAKEAAQTRMDALTQRYAEMQQRSEDKSLDRASREAAAAQARTMQMSIAQMADATRRLAIDTRQEPAPIQTTDQQGNVRLFDRTGKPIANLGPVGSRPAHVVKEEKAQDKLKRDLDEAISGLEELTKKGGLLEKSTGSGIGRGVDIATGMFGYATPGAIAVGQIQPIYDVILKMVPRFEGPQSDKDTQTYKEASGQLANPNVPNSQKRAAANVILNLMRKRRGQFTSKDIAGTEGDSGATSARRAGDVPAGMDPAIWGVMTPEEKALFK